MPDIADEIFRTHAKPKDWVEDFNLENGQYFCVCCICHEEFIGHKRRVRCKECANREKATNDAFKG